MNSKLVSPQAWVFFDLGDTIIDTKSHNYNPMYYMRDVANQDLHGAFRWKDGPLYTSAQAYLAAVQSVGGKIGMLIDAPEHWGVNYPPEAPVVDLPTAKILRMLDFLAGKVPDDHTSWKPSEPAWDYAPFGTFNGAETERIFAGTLVLPTLNTERKSEGSLVLFQRGLALAQAQNCRAIYQGEDAEEMKLAETAGMLPFQVGSTSKKYFYLPPSQIDWYAENYRPGLWQGLGSEDLP